MKTLLLLLLAASMLTGCAKSSNINDRSDDHGEPHFYGSNARAYGDGLTYSAGGISYCLDLGTMEKIPLCARPNCSHTSSDCLAKTAGFGLIYDSYVYYFTEYHGMKERKDGKPYFEMDSKLMRASLDSSETEIVSSFTDSIPRSEETLVIDDDVLYFIAYDPEPEIDDAGGVSYTNGQGSAYLCSVDLDTGGYTNYGGFCREKDYDGRKSSRAYITGISNGKIFIDYSFMQRKGEDFSRIGFEFDVDTKEYTKSELPSAIYADNEVYVWLDDADDELHVVTNGKDNVISYVNYSNSGTVFNNKLFVAGNWIDLSDMTMHRLAANKSVVAYYNGSYITNENNRFEKLTEKELLALDN